MLRLVSLALATALSFGVMADSCGGSGTSTPRRTSGLNQTCFPGYRITVISRDRHTCQGEGIRRGGRADKRPTCGTGYGLEDGTKRYRGGELVRYGCLRVGSTD